MSFSEKTIHSLEFDKIRELLASYAPTEGSKGMARMLMPQEDVDSVLLRQRRTTDAKRLCDAKGMPGFGGVRDVSESCERADKGAVLTPGELLAISAVLRTSRTLIDYCHGNHLFDTVLPVVPEFFESENAFLMMKDAFDEDSRIPPNGIPQKARSNRFEDPYDPKTARTFSVDTVPTDLQYRYIVDRDLHNIHIGRGSPQPPA